MIFVVFKSSVEYIIINKKIADFSDETYDTLCSKHPAAHPNSQIPPTPIVSSQDELDVYVSCVDVIQAIRSFPCGSAGGQTNCTSGPAPACGE